MSATTVRAPRAKSSVASRPGANETDRRHARRHRFAFIDGLAENSRASKKRIRPVTSRLSRMRSGDDDDATAFGPRIQVSACAAWAMAPRSARKRRSVSVATSPGKFGRFVAASTAAKMSDGRRPWKRRITVSAEIEILMRLNASASTAAAIGFTVDKYAATIGDDHGSLRSTADAAGRYLAFPGVCGRQHNASRGAAKSAYGRLGDYAQGIR
jgi:hypothetical protein